MSMVEKKELDLGIGSVERLLATRGRSSTPPPPNDAKIKLADMLRIGYHSASPQHPRLKVATIVHDELYDELEKSYSVMPLLPSTLVNSVDAGQPRMIVIHRSAFQDGPWFGAEDAAGGAAADTIRRLLPWSRKRQVPVLFIENGTPDGYFTNMLREIGTEIFPSEHSGSSVPEGAPRRAIFQIALRFAKAPYAPTNEGGI
ncbi:hypothetical protein [Arthrobacter celericrescens]|uniref:hypothetical protein n=1 Tax=Arthrobacter celericrescens TaxID=2320851 RepID=UPI0013C42FCE|nr:hypothetical protein [Arthrobacter celericrescens]